MRQGNGGGSKTFGPREEPGWGTDILEPNDGVLLDMPDVDVVEAGGEKMEKERKNGRSLTNNDFDR